MAEHAWTDADRELVVSVLWTRARQGGNAGVALELQPAGDAPAHLWGDAAALLDALTAAGWVNLRQVSGFEIDGEVYDPRDVQIWMRPEVSNG